MLVGAEASMPNGSRWRHRGGGVAGASGEAVALGPVTSSVAMVISDRSRRADGIAGDPWLSRRCGWLGTGALGEAMPEGHDPIVEEDEGGEQAQKAECHARVEGARGSVGFSSPCKELGGEGEIPHEYHNFGESTEGAAHEGFAGAPALHVEAVNEGHRGRQDEEAEKVGDADGHEGVGRGWSKGEGVVLRRWGGWARARSIDPRYRT